MFTDNIEALKKYPEWFSWNGEIKYRMIAKVDEDGEYFVTNAGEIFHYHSDTGTMDYLKPYPVKGDYKAVKIHNKTVLVHRQVAKAFISNPMNLPEVHHINGKKYDNCQYNLEWISREEHNARHGKPIVMLDKTTKELICMFQTAAEAERETGIPATGIRDCCKKRYPTYRGFIWMYVSEYETVLKQNG